MSRLVDVLEVILRHADSHRSNAGSDAYSAQEAPKLEAAYSAVAELIEASQAFTSYVAAEHGDKSILDQDAMWDRLGTALARVRGTA